MSNSFPAEKDEVVVNYFVVCDQVITEAQTSKQTIVGIYSALMSEQFPLVANVAVALGIRVGTARKRDISVRFTGPTGEVVFASPALPLDWNSVNNGLQASGFATLQIGLNLRAMPFQKSGVYTAALIADGAVLSTYPLSVLPAQSAGAQGQPQRPQ